MAKRIRILTGQGERWGFMRWILAGVIALLAYAGLAATYKWQAAAWSGPPQQVAFAPAIFIDLAPLPSVLPQKVARAPAAATVALRPQPDRRASAASVEVVDPRRAATAMAPPPVDPRSARPLAELPPRLAPEPRPSTSRRPEPPQSRTAARQSEPAAPPQQAAMPETPAATAMPLPTPRPATPPALAAAKPPEGPPVPAANVRPEQRTERVASAGDGNVSEKERNAAMSAWRDKVATHLQRNQRPPAAAKGKNPPRGTVTISFTVDRRGRVLAEHVARGSGNADLDKEALATLRRAQPLPNFPPEMTQGRTELSLPIRFSAR